MLSSTELNILQALYPNKVIDKNKLAKDYEVDNIVIRNLLVKKLIQNAIADYHSDGVCLTEQGKAKVEKRLYNKNKDLFARRHAWINTAIAAIALLTAIAALIVSILQLGK